MQVVVGCRCAQDGDEARSIRMMHSMVCAGVTDTVPQRNGLSNEVYRNCSRVDDHRHSVAARFGRGSVLIRSIRPLVSSVCGYACRHE